jgi:hypothetical protein
MVKVSKSKKKSEQAMVDAAVEAAVEAAIDSQESEEERDDSVNEEESDDDSESEEDATAIFKGVSVPEEEDAEDGSGDESMDKGNKAKNAAPSQPTLVNGVEQCTFDLRNMLAVNSHQIAPGSLYATKKGSKSADDNITIPLDKGHGLEVDEEFLLSKASAGCTQLVHALWQLPTERSDAGPLVHLPSYDEIKIPRALVSGCVRSSNVLMFLYSDGINSFVTKAAATAERRDKMGKVCQSKGNPSEQREAFAEGLGRVDRHMDVSTWVRKGQRQGKRMANCGSRSK